MADDDVTIEDATRGVIGCEDVHRAFLRREDIAPLCPGEQERRWQEHWRGIQGFLRFLAGETVLIEAGGESES